MNLSKEYINKNKYNAKKTKYKSLDGVERYYDSAMECNYAVQLDWKKKAKIVKEWIPQYKLELYVNGKKICSYKIDFKVIYTDGHHEYVEVKGCITYDFTIKWNLTQALWEDKAFMKMNNIKNGSLLVLAR